MTKLGLTDSCRLKYLDYGRQEICYTNWFMRGLLLQIFRCKNIRIYMYLSTIITITLVADRVQKVLSLHNVYAYIHNAYKL